VSAVLPYLPQILGGLATTARITAVATLLALVMAFAAGTARTAAPTPLRQAAAVYVEVFRGSSLLVQMFWIYYALPAFGVQLGAFAAGVLTLGLNVGAYGAEVVRGAILAVPRGQVEAAISLGFSPALRLRRILVPQALPRMIPPLGNLAIELLKGTALVSLITIHDLTFRGQMVRSVTLETGAVFGLILLLYLLCALVITGAVRLLERRIQGAYGVPRDAG
jgi:polar amino acid transport system permease protein